ncbi:MAG: 2-oxoacid:acceptor oxidoreductase subunit alpha [Gemmatimonadetes bacterium]|nr:MAG: 2-oxoacid:acceptor oxidoreductase subunit alpha [Gemmatimonadota bacterium]
MSVNVTDSARETTGTGKHIVDVPEHIVEIVSDSGEGAQKAAQSFGAICAKMGNGIWTVEIIPAEIQPPPRSIAGASGNRIRIGSFSVTNAGDQADLVVAFNEQVLLGRVQSGNLKPGAIILLESMWRDHHDPEVVRLYTQTVAQLEEDGYQVKEIPMETECLKIVENPRKGKNMFVLGMLCSIYQRDLQLARDQIEFTFQKKSQKVIEANIQLLEAGYNWAEANLDVCFNVPSAHIDEPQIVVNGNIAIGLGVMASGMEVCAMYPITPATSASHYLSDVFENVGGVVHQAEDEIAACAFAIGASYAGKCAVTITSGPGKALKTELIGLAVMAEIPLVLVDVQRGGPSTGLPTKVEQGDLLSVIFGEPGDAPKIVMAPATIEDCFYSIITARKIAETFRMPVIVLSDANLATGQQLFPRPKFNEDWVAPPIDQSPVPEGKKPYDWDPVTGLSERFIPGRPNGMHTVTGLAHDQNSKVAYDNWINQAGCEARSRKLAAFQKTLKTPQVMGDPEGGDLLILGWGSTKGAIEEAVMRVRKDGLSVSSLHLKFLQPMASGIGDILRKFKQTICVEINYSDPKDDFFTADNRRYSNLAWLLRARYLVDVDSWSNVYGQPMKPGDIEQMIRERFATP